MILLGEPTHDPFFQCLTYKAQGEYKCPLCNTLYPNIKQLIMYTPQKTFIHTKHYMLVTIHQDLAITCNPQCSQTYNLIGPT